MNIENAQRMIRDIGAEALVLDVGGGAAPFPRADWVIDAVPFQGRGTGSHGNINEKLAGYQPRYAEERWVVADLCEHRPWPFADKQFDFVTCSHLLEDVRDPIWICSELKRVARAGYIEVPSRYVEQSRGIENPRHCGFFHHRWLVSKTENRLEFRMKPHCLHSVSRCWVASLGASQRINPRYEILTLEWNDSFEAREILAFDEDIVMNEMAEFAQKARQLPDLITSNPLQPMDKLKREIFYMRMRMGRR